MPFEIDHPVSITNKPILSVRLIDVNHNNTVTILFIKSSSLINLEQKQEECSHNPPYFEADNVIMIVFIFFQI